MATDPREVTLAKLTSIDATLKAILLVLSEKRNDAPSDQSIHDRVLDGPHGNPVIKAKDPRDWSGDSMNGRTFSECPPEYLDLLADRYDYFSTKPDQEPSKVRYAQIDAQRARGWAARLRAGWTPPVAPRVNEADSEPTW